MKPYEIFNKKFNKENLRRIYEENVRFKSAVGNDKVTHSVFAKNLEEELDIIHRKVMNNTYKFTTYRQKLVLKGKGKNPREVSMCSIRDKITLVALKEVLTEVFGREVNTDLVQTYMHEIKEHLNPKYCNTVIKLDMINFYGTIDHDILKEILRKKTRKLQLLDLVTKAIKTGTAPIGRATSYRNQKGIPQGLPISNILSTIYLKDFDQSQVLKGAFGNYRYFRYVDDILVLCRSKDSVKVAKSLIEELEGRYKLEVHKISKNSSKSTIKTLEEGFEYLGYKYSNGEFSVRKGSVQKMERRIEYILNEYKHGKYNTEEALKLRLNYKITGFISMEDEKYGWLFFFSQLENLQVLYRLDSLVKKLLKRNSISSEGVKSFVRTHHEILYKLSKTNYIPKLKLKSPQEKLRELKLYSDDPKLDGFTENQINIEYRRYQRMLKKEKERDMQGIS